VLKYYCMTVPRIREKSYFTKAILICTWINCRSLVHALYVSYHDYALCIQRIHLKNAFKQIIREKLTLRNEKKANDQIGSFVKYRVGDFPAIHPESLLPECTNTTKEFQLSHTPSKIFSLNRWKFATAICAAIVPNLISLEIQSSGTSLINIPEDHTSCAITLGDLGLRWYLEKRDEFIPCLQRWLISPPRCEVSAALSHTDRRTLDLRSFHCLALWSCTDLHNSHNFPPYWLSLSSASSGSPAPE